VAARRRALRVSIPAAGFVKLLALLPESPFPWSSTAARYYGPMIKELARCGHDVTVLAVGHAESARDQPAGYFDRTGVRLKFIVPPVARPFLERKARSMWRSGWELSVSPFGDAARAEADRNYDGIIAEQVSTARVLEGYPRVLCTLHCVRHVDIRADPPSPLRYVRAVQIKREETSTLRRVPAVRVLSRALASRVASIAPHTPMHVVPLCIDPELYPEVSTPRQHTVGLIGSMFWQPSRAAARHFIEQIVPRLKVARPDLKYLVAGWHARRYLSSIADRGGVELIEDFEHPREIFERLSVMVYTPPAGTGMKVKVLEAMAYGVPVVTNEHGAEGLEADPAPGIWLTASDAETCDAVLELLCDATKRRSAVEYGHAAIARTFSPEAVAPQIIRCFDNPS
jgi:glycosyltransferase involved in cell wall biosynthesis